MIHAVLGTAGACATSGGTGATPAWFICGSLVNVKQYGVTGNGSTVDGTAILAAITANPTGALYFPPGTYLLNNAASVTGLAITSGFGGSITFAPGASLSCNTITVSTAGTCVSIVGTSNVSIYNMTVTYTGIASLPLARANATNFAVLLEGNTNLLLDNPNILASTGTCFWADQNGGSPENGLKVRNISYNKCTADGVHFESVQNLTLNGVWSASSGTTSGDDGLAFSATTTVGTQYGGITAQGIHIQGSQARGIAIFGPYDLNLSDCDVKNTAEDGITVYTDSAYSSYTPYGVTISNCTVTGAGTIAGQAGNQYGVEFTNTNHDQLNNVIVNGSESDGIDLTSCVDCKISSSTVSNTVLGKGLSVFSSAHLGISNFHVDTTYDYGMYFNGSTDVTGQQLSIRNASTNTGTGLNRAFFNEAMSGASSYDGLSITDDQSTATGFQIGDYNNGAVPISVKNISYAITNGTFGLATFGNSAGTTYSFAGLAAPGVLSAAYTNATTTFSSVAGLAFPIGGNQNLTGHCYIVYSASAATAGPKIQFTGPASPTAVNYSSMFQITATPTYIQPAAASAFATSLSPGTAVTASTRLTASVDYGIINGGTAGTVQLQAAANGTGTVTIEPGSWCKAQ